jgi:hypothetical protein
MLWHDLETDVCFHGVPIWGTCGDASFLGPLREGKFLYLGKCYKKFENYTKKCPVSGKLCGGPVGDLEGVRLLGPLTQKERTQRILKVNSVGNLKLQQGTGLP